MNITTYLLLNSITHYILLSDYSLLPHSLLLLIYHELDHKHTSLHSHLSTHNFVTTYHPIHHFITLDIKSSTFISLYFQLLYLNHTCRFWYLHYDHDNSLTHTSLFSIPRDLFILFIYIFLFLFSCRNRFIRRLLISSLLLLPKSMMNDKLILLPSHK